MKILLSIYFRIKDEYVNFFLGRDTQYGTRHSRALAQMATTIIITTNNFKKFDNWRKFASYSGIAPFSYQSGTSIKGRTKVSHLANKKVKALIHLCAISAIQHNPEMKKYYLKRIKTGKSKMSTINIIRNKLIARVFAVIKRQTPYVDTMKFAA